MIVLWVAAALMTVTVLVVLLFPLLRARGAVAPARAEYDIAVFKDQLSELERDLERGLLDDSEAEAAKIEIQRRMLAATEIEDVRGEAAAGTSRRLAAAIGLALPAAAFGFYVYLGQPEAPNQPFAGRDISGEIAQRQGRLDKREVLQMAAKLERRLKNDPKDAGAWMLLARTYMTISEFEPALAAYEQAMTIGNRHPDIASDYAEALIIAEQGRVTTQAKDLYRDIFDADAINPKARYYLGLALAQEGKTGQALQAWVDLRAVSPTQAPWLGALNTQIEGAAKKLGVSSGSVKPTAAAIALAKTLPPPPSSSPAAPAASSQATSQAPGPSRADMEAASQMTAGDRSQMIRTMVQRLADKLKDNPDDLDGWKRLARAYEVLGETEKAKAAQDRIRALSN